MYIKNAPIFFISLILLAAFLFITIYLAMRISNVEKRSSEIEVKVEKFGNELNNMKAARTNSASTTPKKKTPVAI